MKRISNLYGRLQSPESKLQKRKRKLKTQNDEVQDANIKKLKIQIINCCNKQTVALNCEENASLKEIKGQINEKLKRLKLKTEQLIGFESSNCDYAFDYRFQVGIGTLDKSIKLNCLYFSNERGLEKYKICCCLAIGGFSKVFLVRSRINGSFFAAKFIDKSKKQLINEKLLENQKQISLRLNSQYLVKTHQFIETDEFYVFIMDYCPGGELFYLLKQIKCMSQSQARICFIQILLGIEHLHDAGFMYRDLKPQNILLDAHGYMKIADFGLAKPYFQKSYSFCGSVQYMAPQIIKGKGHQKFVDFYCLGALLYEMLIGHPPFYDSRLTAEETKKRIIYEQISFPKYIILSNEAKDLIKKLTQKNARQRLGYFNGCKQIMIHPWIGKIDRKRLEEKNIQTPFPVNLNQLNFDPDQIGLSQRAFQLRINSQISSSKNKRDNKQKSEGKEKCHSQKATLKIMRSPYKNKSLMHSFQIKQRSSKSPYEQLIKNSKSLKKLKNREQKTEGKKNYMDYVRWTQSNCAKENKLVQATSKLRKKCKYVHYMTTTMANDNQKSTENIRWKNSLLTSQHFV